ncbi:YdeI/OmpD-associated family protein [Reichenbachiella carrageenanivorans]|uniref:YdeI/OmpD-associated family protein n=1 Tax=Reichenbachiella carrageenanivorans TaxID=2979869 RepID=A0ABY6CUR7_9BACT|nr:YdeI/OmpD-associated family protein [Reichenbachiella carrageenanivorans]UXX77662.1 YdeI/OmpD-associated family protein [Reichenbachiella carrageenanivorans]
MNAKVDIFFEKLEKWQEEMGQLRAIVWDCGLTEELKWGVPCYTTKANNKEKNVVLIHGFKGYCALNFFNGALLKDTEGILVQPTEHVQAARQIRFTHWSEIVEMKAVLKAYIFEAIEVEKAGLKVNLKTTDEFSVPEEFQKKLKEMPSLKAAFEALTPGRQKGYLLHFDQAKQSKTRESRIAQCMPKIMAGKGLKDCTCGLSKRQPYCDGSHKYI